MIFIDSHCHLDFEAFDTDREAVIQRARDVGIGRMVTICTRVRQFEKVLAIAEAYPEVYCSVGTHPHNADEELDVTVEDLVALAAHPKVVAIGEAGLDYHYDNASREAQAIGLERHIEAARRTGLPLVIHARSADADMIKILKRETAAGPIKAVLHCFSSSPELAATGMELGLFVSFSGILTFKNSAQLKEIAREVPLDRMLVETDAPYLAPVPYRGKRNEPAYVFHTLAALAELRSMSVDSIATVTTDNFFSLFSKVPRPSAGESAAAAA